MNRGVFFRYVRCTFFFLFQSYVNFSLFLCFFFFFQTSTKFHFHTQPLILPTPQMHKQLGSMGSHISLLQVLQEARSKDTQYWSLVLLHQMAQVDELRRLLLLSNALDAVFRLAAVAQVRHPDSVDA